MTPVALLVIDIQQAAFDGVFCPPIDRAADLVANAGSLVTAARAAGTPVIFVQHCEGKGEPFEEGTPHWQFHEQLTPQPGDLVVRKYASSAFENTDLQTKLDALGARELVVCGLQSDFCVSNTSKSALSLGYRVRIASDAHSTWDLDGETAAAISERVNAGLQTLGAVLDSTASIAQTLRRLPGDTP
jgi:nicotinamidase-related amidase